MASEHKHSTDGAAGEPLSAEVALKFKREAYALADEVTETVEMLSAAQAQLNNSIQHLLQSNTDLVRARVVTARLQLLPVYPAKCSAGTCAPVHACIVYATALPAGIVPGPCCAESRIACGS